MQFSTQQNFYSTNTQFFDKQNHYQTAEIFNNKRIENRILYGQHALQQIKWKNIQKLDPQKVRIMKDFKVLESYMPNIRNSSISKEEFIFNNENNENNFKLFQLLQLQIQYMQDSCNQQDFYINSKKKEIKQIQEEQQKQNILIQKKKQTIFILKEQIKKTKEKYTRHKTFILSKPQFRCSFCPNKYFMTEEYLDKHVQKRHFMYFIKFDREQIKSAEEMIQLISSKQQVQDDVIQRKKLNKLKQQEKSKIKDTDIIINKKAQINLENAEQHNKYLIENEIQKQNDLQLKNNNQIQKFLKEKLTLNKEKTEQFSKVVQERIEQMEQNFIGERNDKKNIEDEINKQIQNLRQDIRTIKNQVDTIKSENFNPSQYFGTNSLLQEQQKLKNSNMSQSNQSDKKSVVEEIQNRQKEAFNIQAAEVQDQTDMKKEHERMMQNESDVQNIHLLNKNIEYNAQYIETDPDHTEESQNDIQSDQDIKKSMDRSSNSHGAALGIFTSQNKTRKDSIAKNLNNQVDSNQYKQEAFEGLRQEENLFKILKANKGQQKLNDKLGYNQVKNLIPIEISAELNRQKLKFSVQELNTLQDQELEKSYKKAKEGKIDEAIFGKMEKVQNNIGGNGDQQLESSDSSDQQDQPDSASVDIEKLQESGTDNSSEDDDDDEDDEIQSKKQNQPGHKYNKSQGVTNLYQQNIQGDGPKLEQNHIIGEPYNVSYKDSKFTFKQDLQFLGLQKKQKNAQKDDKFQFKNEDNQIGKQISGYNPNSFPKHF